MINIIGILLTVSAFGFAIAACGENTSPKGSHDPVKPAPVSSSSNTAPPPPAPTTPPAAESQASSASAASDRVIAVALKDENTEYLFDPGDITVSNGETVTLDPSTWVGTFADSAVGEDRTVTVTGLVPTGTHAANYTILPYTTEATIGKKELTVSDIDASDKEYDGNTSATLSGTGTLGGVVGTEQVGLNDPENWIGTFSDTDAKADKTVTVTGLDLTGTHEGNYSLPAYTTTATIENKELTASGIDANNKVYDGDTTATLGSTYSLDGIVDGETVTLDTTNP